MLHSSVFSVAFCLSNLAASIWIVYIVNNRAWRHIHLNVLIQYNVPLKGNPVKDEWNIETSKDLFSKDP